MIAAYWKVVLSPNAVSDSCLAPESAQCHFQSSVLQCCPTTTALPSTHCSLTVCHCACHWL
jgi:hypothetical protein